jgi:hypothetical protein
MSRNDPVELAHDGIKHRTDKAVLVDFGDREEWIPLSLVEAESEETITVPEWKAEDLGLWGE